MKAKENNRQLMSTFSLQNLCLQRILNNKENGASLLETLGILHVGETFFSIIFALKIVIFLDNLLINHVLLFLILLTQQIHPYVVYSVRKILMIIFCAIFYFNILK
jgi:hypothetical protein